MSEKPIKPAIEGWFSDNNGSPHLLGSRCTSCGTYYFPKTDSYCRSPLCDSESFEEVPLSRTGTVWSYTNACYAPPAPYVAADPHVPFTIAAVSLEAEQMIVLGQVVEGVDVADLTVGDSVELVLEPLHETEENVVVTWKWRPIAGAAS